MKTITGKIFTVKVSVEREKTVYGRTSRKNMRAEP